MTEDRETAGVMTGRAYTPVKMHPAQKLWLQALSVVVTAATLATLDWAAARWTTTATVPLGFPGGPVLDVQARKGLVTGIEYQKRARPHTGRLERP